MVETSAGQPGHRLFRPAFRLTYGVLLTGTDPVTAIDPPVNLSSHNSTVTVTGIYQSVTGRGPDRPRNCPTPQ
jgi:hypothetical protein